MNTISDNFLISIIAFKLCQKCDDSYSKVSANKSNQVANFGRLSWIFDEPIADGLDESLRWES